MKSVVYVTDTETRKIRVKYVNGKRELANPRPFFQLPVGIKIAHPVKVDVNGTPVK